MPLEIKELSIKISIDQGGGNGAANIKNADPMSEPDPMLVEACVEKVLETIKRQQER